MIYCSYIIWLTNSDNPADTTQINNDSPSIKTVSIIISARNEEKNLPNLINSLTSQTYPKDQFEIIIANDRSNDGTGKLLNNYQKNISNLTVIHIENTALGWAPKKWALHNAIEISKGEIILQTDADCILPEKWIYSMSHPFNNPEIGFVSGPAPMTNNESLIDNIFEIDSLAQDAFSAGGFNKNMIFSCTGRNMGFLKNAYDDVNGYEEISHFISGDDDLLLQLITSKSQYSANFVQSNDAIVISPPPENINEFINQRMRFASKGLEYYKINTSTSLKITLPLLYSTNLFVLLTIFKFIQNSSPIFLVPLVIKSFADWWITYNFYHNIKLKWKIIPFLFLSILHPIYIVIFGAIGPFYKFSWKKND